MGAELDQKAKDDGKCLLADVHKVSWGLSLRIQGKKQVQIGVGGRRDDILMNKVQEWGLVAEQFDSFSEWLSWALA